MEYEFGMCDTSYWCVHTLPYTYVLYVPVLTQCGIFMNIFSGPWYGTAMESKKIGYIKDIETIKEYLLLGFDINTNVLARL